MSEPSQHSEPLSLWECLHDGTIVSLETDSMARSFTVIVESDFHREFHELPADSRLRIVGQNVRIAELFDLEPWVGATEPATDKPWKEAHEVRLQNFAKGLLISTDWKAFTDGIAADEDFLVMSAVLRMDQPLDILELGVMCYPSSNYRTVMIHAESFRFHVGERELSLDEFREFGAAYWKDWAAKSKVQSAQNDPAQADTEKNNV
jgi:hypothetical protein